MSIEVGSTVEGVVTGITNFGAFVELPGGEVGLIHISEVADTYVKDVKDYLKDKDKVTVKVISIDGKGKIGLSIKQVNNPEGKPSSVSMPRRPKRPQRRQQQAPPPKANFEDKMAKFMKDSDERQQTLKKNTESKRGGRGAKKSY